MGTHSFLTTVQTQHRLQVIGKTDAEIQPLHTGARLNLGDRVLGEVERNSFIALPGREGHSGLMPSKLFPAGGGGSEEFCSNGTGSRA